MQQPCTIPAQAPSRTLRTMAGMAAYAESCRRVRSACKHDTNGAPVPMMKAIDVTKPRPNTWYPNSASYTGCAARH